MKKFIIPALVLAASFTACEPPAEAGMTQEEMDAQVDSIVGERLDELNEEANEDLDRRMAIEVKLKADSIVEARNNQ